ncbi:MAG: SPASM domain-containing protein [Firmicutes bacterium]|nr:SPASM domain-containing protein [Bacillota bacterium]
MRCRLCFSYQSHTSSGDIRRMSLATLERLISEAVIVSSGQVFFGWQGGEPTLMGLDFFREAVRLQEKYRRPGQKIGNAFQTNGLLLTPEWCEFLAENHFLVGLSLDGEPVRHDAERLDPGGLGTYDRVVRALHLLQEYRVRTNILTVVTPDIARRGRQTYRALRNLQAEYIQFIPSVDNGQQDVPEPLRLSADGYGRFLKNVYDEWIADLKAGQRVGVQFFESLASVALGLPPVTCQTAGTCAGHLVVEYDGSLYPCDFMVRPEWYLGNIHAGPLMEILQGAKLREFLQWTRQIPTTCRSCEFFPYCRGGCPYQRTMKNGDPSRPDYFCRSYKTFFRYALPQLIQLGRMAGSGGAGGSTAGGLGASSAVRDL